MRPIKNRKYCVGCNASKMLFESKRSADNFIKYNSEEIMKESGRAPVRSYYCHFCGGWHVTSNASQVAGEMMNSMDMALRRRLDNRMKEREAKKAELKALSVSVREKCREAEFRVMMGDVDEAEDLLDTCDLLLESSLGDRSFGGWSIVKCENRPAKVRNLVEMVKQVMSMTSEEQDECLSVTEPTVEEKRIQMCVRNIRWGVILNGLLEKIEDGMDVDLNRMLFHKTVDMLDGKANAMRKEYFINRLNALAS